MSDCLILYIIHDKACNPGMESTDIPVSDEWSICTRIQLACRFGAQNTIVHHT